MLAATGEIVAYTDDDARPDPHWLQYLAHSFQRYGFAGVGGPNVAPAGDGSVADCVANAPGGPVHVLLSDRVAEHIPGRNMAFRHEVLQEVGGATRCTASRATTSTSAGACSRQAARSAASRLRFMGVDTDTLTSC
jgi:cellulose synthase/poly-beta-1,6-N-acetylglucosamine synthase-like glycosyltransferase